MPELPEVETVKNGLKKQIIGKTVSEIKLSDKQLRRKTNPNIESILKNAKVKKLERRAKVLYVHFDNKYSLLFHLGMTGKLVFDLKSIPKHLQKHNHISIFFSDSSYLIFNDIRRFGFVDLVKTSEIENLDYIKNLAPEPLTEEFNELYLQKKLAKKQIAIKAAIMDNSIVVGVGNIYASESLFKARIHPMRKSNSLSLKELEALIKAIKETLIVAIEKGGSTLRDYVQSDGSLGYFQHEFFVYGRDGEPCKVCGSTIKKRTIAQRSTFYCDKCQN